MLSVNGLLVCIKNSELLVHAADVEGLCQGIDEQLVEKLGEWCTLPVTYAGGGSSKYLTLPDGRYVQTLTFFPS
jgi:hypothetical protein